MFSHVTIGTRDLPRAVTFYDAALAPLGILRVQGQFAGWASWQRPGEVGKLWVGEPHDGQPASHGNGWMVALAAPSRAAVDAAYAAAMVAGGTDEGAPGPRPQYTADYYGAYVRDPDGNKLHSSGAETEGQGLVTKLAASACAGSARSSGCSMPHRFFVNSGPSRTLKLPGPLAACRKKEITIPRPWPVFGLTAHTPLIYVKRGCWHSIKRSANSRRNPIPLVSSNTLQATETRRILSMKFRPLHDRVVVRRVEQETKSAGGIIIPDTAAEKPQQGEIIAVGPGARDESGKIVPLDVKPKDKVLFGKWSGTEVKIDGQELLIMKESDVMGVLDR